VQSNEKQPSRRATRHQESPRIKIDLPSSFELRTAIKVLEKLTERITQDSAHSAMQMPDSQLGNQYAATIGKDAAAKMDQIKVVKQQLENWQQELKELRRHYVSNRI
jgi:hypothetical protein